MRSFTLSVWQRSLKGDEGFVYSDLNNGVNKSTGIFVVFSYIICGIYDVVQANAPFLAERPFAFDLY